MNNGDSRTLPLAPEMGCRFLWGWKMIRWSQKEKLRGIKISRCLYFKGIISHMNIHTYRDTHILPSLNALVWEVLCNWPLWLHTVPARVILKLLEEKLSLEASQALHCLTGELLGRLSQVLLSFLFLHFHQSIRGLRGAPGDVALVRLH